MGAASLRVCTVLDTKKTGASKYWPWLLRSIKASKRAWERTARKVDDLGIETDLTRQRRREHFCRPGQALPSAAPLVRREHLKTPTSSKKVVNKTLSSHLVRWLCRTEATTFPVITEPKRWLDKPMNSIQSGILILSNPVRNRKDVLLTQSTRPLYAVASDCYGLFWEAHCCASKTLKQIAISRFA